MRRTVIVVWAMLCGTAAAQSGPSAMVQAPDETAVGPADDADAAARLGCYAKFAGDDPAKSMMGPPRLTRSLEREASAQTD